jgi:hypothetical protein
LLNCGKLCWLWHLTQVPAGPRDCIHENAAFSGGVLRKL